MLFILVAWTSVEQELAVLAAGMGWRWVMLFQLSFLRAVDKREYLVIIMDTFVNSAQNHMMRPLIWTVSSRRFRWGVTTYGFDEMVQMKGHNIWFRWEIKINIIKCPLLSRALLSASPKDRSVGTEIPHQRDFELKTINQNNTRPASVLFLVSQARKRPY